MLKNQKGFSLAIVLVVSALVTANVYYFLSMDTKSKTENAQNAARVNEFAEKRRIISYLSDYQTCTHNFAGAPLPQSLTPLVPSSYPVLASQYTNVVPSPPATLEKANLSPATGYTPFLVNGLFYIGATHRLTRWMIENSGPGPLYPGTTVPDALRYNLIVQYEIPKEAGNVAGRTLKKRATEIRIPLYVEFDGTNKITKCYARPENTLIQTTVTGTDIENAVKGSCMGDSAWLTDSLPLPNPNAYKLCTHDVASPTLTPNNWLGGVKIGTAASKSNDIEFDNTQAKLVSSCTTGNPYPYLLRSVGASTAAAADCAQPDTCPNNQMMVRSGSGFVCMGACPPGAKPASAYLFNSIALNGAITCYERTSPCGPGTYASTINPDGSVICSTMKVVAENCGANAFATDYDTNQLSDPLKCSGYSRVKSCATPSRYTYVSALTSHPTVACRVYTN